MLDLQVSYESLIQVGSMMGSGGMIVMDDTSCMVNVARFFMEFCMTESCGKCIPCRAGTAQMLTLLSRICDGSGTMEDLDLLVELCGTVKETSLCGLGRLRRIPFSAPCAISETSTSNTSCTSAAPPASATLPEQP